ncbi:hypothetical protein XENOCAPTIV_025363, partial [Xenoophorus captivus]
QAPPPLAARSFAGTRPILPDQFLADHHFTAQHRVALTCFLCIKGSQSALIMSSGSPDKRRKMESALNQLKKLTVVVADTGDFNGKKRPTSTPSCC